MVKVPCLDCGKAHEQTEDCSLDPWDEYHQKMVKQFNHAAEWLGVDWVEEHCPDVAKAIVAEIDDAVYDAFAGFLGPDMWELASDEFRGLLEQIVEDRTETYPGKLAELDGLLESIAKMTHRRCWKCGHIAYYVLPILPYCQCEKCGSDDTRAIKEP